MNVSKRLIPCAAFAALFNPVFAQVTPSENYLRLGLTDVAHTGAPGSLGIQSTSLGGVSEAGYAYGTSSQPALNGNSVWLANLGAGTVTRVGFADAEHTSSTGTQNTGGANVQAGAWLGGSTTRYQGGSASLGETAWIANADSGVTQRVGFTGTGYTATNGYQNSAIIGIFDTYATGVSYRYTTMNSFGNATWVSLLSNLSVQSRIGLYDAEHTHTSGYQATIALYGTSALNYVAGTSARYNGGSPQLGQSAWAADATTGTTHRIGFYDTAHTFTVSGVVGQQQYSRIVGQGAGGWIGESIRDRPGDSITFQLSNTSEFSAWFYDPVANVTKQLGFTGGVYEFAPGRANSRVFDISAEGNVVGHSQRSGFGEYGYLETWVMNLATNNYTLIGLHDDEHRRSDGDVEEAGRGALVGTERVFRFTKSGYLAGMTYQWVDTAFFPTSQGNIYHGAKDFGESPWVYTVATGVTTRFGLIDAEHTRINGVRYSYTDRYFGDNLYLSEEGYMGGAAWQYSGTEAQTGLSAWLGNAATGVTQRVGFYDVEHTNNANFKSSEITKMTTNGYAIGSSRRYNGGTQQLGQSVWLAHADSAQTLRIGFYDTTHTANGVSVNNPAGEQYSTVVAVNRLGQATGHSNRYIASGTASGSSAWVANFSTGNVVRVGLFTGSHLSTSGLQYSYASGLTDAGLAWGYSSRFTGNNSAGQTAWIYDIVSEAQTVFALSIRSTDGYAFSQIDAINADGLALGHYEAFSATNVYLGKRGFIWSTELGVVDLYDSFTGTGAKAWSTYFEGNAQLLESGWVIVNGTPENPNSGTGYYALNYTPTAVPEPATWAAIFGGVVLLMAAVFRRRPAARF